MTKEEFEKLKETFAYFEHWSDVIGEKMVSILKKSIEHITNLEKENTDQKDQLAKAKELLNACIFKARGNVNPSWSELINDIEQFLREINTDNATQKVDESCPDVLCKDCNKEDCIARKLGLIC